MADAPASGAGGGNPVEVQVLSAAPSFSIRYEVFAMEDYQLFEEFLNEEDIFFKSGEFPSGDPYFRIPQKIKNGTLVEAIVVFEEINVKVIFIKIASVETPEKEMEMLKLFNDLNRSYKFFTFYLDSSNDITFEGNLPADLRDGEFQPKELMAYIISAIKSLEEAYPQIMKIVWAD